MWTTINRNKTEERSVIDYIMITQQISRYIKTITVDEEGNLRKKRNWPQYDPNVNQNQRPQKTIIPRKMETQQQRGMGKIQRSYKTSLLKQQSKNRQLPRSRKGNKKHNEEHSGNKENQNRQNQTNQQPYDKGKKKYNETQQKRIPKNLECRNPWTKSPRKRSQHEKSKGTTLWNKKGWNKKK